MINLIGQVVTIVKKPLVPTLVHDPGTRIYICAIGILIILSVLYYIGKYYGR